MNEVLETAEDEKDKAECNTVPTEISSDNGAYGGARPKTKKANSVKSTRTTTSAAYTIGWGRVEDNLERDYLEKVHLSKHESPLHGRKPIFHRTNSSDSVFLMAHEPTDFFAGNSRTERSSFDDWETDFSLEHRCAPNICCDKTPLLASYVTDDSNDPSVTNSTLSVSDAKSEDPSDLDNLDTIEDDCYIYTYRGGTAYLSADLPNSFFRLDSGSDGESLPGVSGAGQSNLSTGVAALLQDQLLNVPLRSDSPDEPDFLELDFDPGSDASDSSSDSGQGREEDIIPGSNSPLVVAAGVVATSRDSSPSRLLPETSLLNPIVDDKSPRCSSSRRTSETSMREEQEAVSVSPELVLHIQSNSNSEIKTRTIQPLEISFQNNNNAVDGAKDSIECGESVCHSCDTSNLSVLPPDSPQQLANAVSAVRSAPLASPVKEVQLLSNIPRSKSLNNSMSSCLATDGGTQSDDDNLLLCGNRLLLRETLLFGPESSGLDKVDINEALQKLSMRLQRPKSGLDTPRVMIWSEKEACRKQVSQTGASNCGAVSIINVMTALNICVDELDVYRQVRTRLRRERSDIPDYLLSRSEAGANHIDLLNGVKRICGDRVVGRFFPMAGRVLSLSDWLANWMSRGCVPVATLNLQRASTRPPGMPIADSWHHQMIWGLSGRDIFLTNPLEVVLEQDLFGQLDSPSELLIRREDVLPRFCRNTDLSPLIWSDVDFGQRWRDYNVLGQIVNLLREENSLLQPDENITITSHIKIPANYVSGITLFCDDKSPDVRSLLFSAADFPSKTSYQK